MLFSYILIVLSFQPTSYCLPLENFRKCLSQNSSNISNLAYTQNDTSYFSVLNFSIQNPRFSSPLTPKPLVIITPKNPSHVQAAVICARRHGLQVRTRSGGHDYEGLSYVSRTSPFAVIDLINLRSVIVNPIKRTARVQAGATIGEVYYRIAEKSSTLGFPSAIASTVGVGGLFSGGGYGNMLRKHGLSADHVIDAKIVDARGKIRDRKSMGDDLFWGIRGGGGASFGVILAWKIRLVQVPSTVTVFTVSRNLEQNATSLVHRWQSVADKFDKDLFILVRLQAIASANSVNNKTIQASFISLFLGGANNLIPLMRLSFPELGLAREDCNEMSWIDSVVYFAGFPVGTPHEALLVRTPEIRLATKGKSDYVKVPIPVDGLEGIWERFFDEGLQRALIQMTPYGGKMGEIPERETPFPHRAGNIYKILYLVATFGANGSVAEPRDIDWIRRLYAYMTPYVSKNPREAYANYRDLDLGTNYDDDSTSFAQASVWGFKYFKNNFKRLVRVKSLVDPTNFFRNEQSIPVAPP